MLHKLIGGPLDGTVIESIMAFERLLITTLEGQHSYRSDYIQEIGSQVFYRMIYETISLNP